MRVYRFCLFFVSKVQRKSRYRLDRAGAVFTEEDKQSWHAEQLCFMKRKAASAGGLPEQAAKRLRREVAKPRLATLDWLRCMQNAMDGPFKDGMQQWLPAHRPWDDDLKIGERMPGCLVMLFDQLQLQWCGYYYLVNKRKANMLALLPPIHRRDNDCSRATALAGFWGTHMRDLCVGNIVYGAWSSHKFWHELVDMSLEAVAGLDADSPVLLFLWPAICMDFEWFESHETNRAARAAYIRSLPSLREVRTKGPFASTGKWMSVFQSTQYRDRTRNTKLLLLTLVAIRKSWISSWQKWFDPPSYTTAKVASEPASSASSSSAAAVPKAGGGLAKAKARAKGKRHLLQRRRPRVSTW